jgi:hypothetical protein
VNIGPTADTVDDGQAQTQTCDVDRNTRESVNVLEPAEIVICMYFL